MEPDPWWRLLSCSAVRGSTGGGPALLVLERLTNRVRYMMEFSRNKWQNKGLWNKKCKFEIFRKKNLKKPSCRAQKVSKWHFCPNCFMKKRRRQKSSPKGPIWTKMSFYNFLSSTRWLLQIFFSINFKFAFLISKSHNEILKYNLLEKYGMRIPTPFPEVRVSSRIVSYCRTLTTTAGIRGRKETLRQCSLVLELKVILDSDY